MTNLIEHEPKRVNSADISFATDNPRGLTPTQITGDPEFKKLKASIAEQGILEPLIIKRKNRGYVLVDGERRLRAAKEVGAGDVPAIIVKSETTGRVLAYQIHMLRVNWEKPAETKAIKKIINDLRDENPRISDKEIQRQLMILTAHKAHELSDLLKLARYDNETIDKVIEGELNMSYLVQIESSFLAPLRKQYPAVVSDIGEGDIRKYMIQKALRGELGGTRFLMDEFCIVFKNRDETQKPEIEELLRTFILKKKSGESVLDDYRLLCPEAARGATKKEEKKPAAKDKKAKRRKKQRSTSTTTTEARFVSGLKVSRRQQTSINDVRKKYERLSSELSDEEREYISEALWCLEYYCFKAAALMMWSAIMSRVWAYASRNLSNFQNASVAMNATRKSVYKHYARDFQTRFTSIEDIRERAHDMHPLCFLAYKKAISTTEFRRLKADYETRCDCAHPTDIKLSVNKIVDLFDNGHELIFVNSTLR